MQRLLLEEAENGELEHGGDSWGYDGVGSRTYRLDVSEQRIGSISRSASHGGPWRRTGCAGAVRGRDGPSGALHSAACAVNTSTTRSPRRAVLRDLRSGRRDRTDVCDAHPELLRAGRHIGEVQVGDCPVCGNESLRLVSYVYGDALRQANGRCIATDQELAKLEATHEEFSRYVVEVCLDCRWNNNQGFNFGAGFN